MYCFYWCSVWISSVSESDTQEMVRIQAQEVAAQNAAAAPPATIPQYVDQLVQGDKYTILAIGQTLTLAEFQKIGKFYIEERLIYDNYLLDDKDVGC